MYLFPLDWHAWNNPYCMDEEMFCELVERIGNDAIYGTVLTDAATISALNEYFARDRLCDYDKAFIWLYRRAIMRAYPVYKDSMDLWKERLVKGYFWDNQKSISTTTDRDRVKVGDLTKDIIGDVDRRIKEILDGNAVTDFTSTRNTDVKTTDDSTTTGTIDQTVNSKNRQFAFNYPESNYTGGVIPYDLDNNPSVEFLNTQADGVARENTHTESESVTNEQGTSDTDENYVSNQKHKTDNTTSKTDDTDSTTNTKQNTKDTDNIDEIVIREYTATDITDITDKVLAELPITDFFAQFADKLQPCFQRVYLADTNLRERGFNFYV